MADSASGRPDGTNLVCLGAILSVLEILRRVAVMPLILWILLALPPAALLIIFLLRRSKSLADLSPALLLSGLTGALLTAVFAFMSSTVPIAPYELPSNSWSPILGGLLVAMYVGFGLGVLLAAAMGVPYWYVSGRAKPTRPSAASHEDDRRD